MDICAAPTTSSSVVVVSTPCKVQQQALATGSATPCKVQQVTKASSDQLLSKFAELDPDPPNPALAPPRRSSAAAAQHLIRTALRTKRAAASRRTSGGSRDLRFGVGGEGPGSRRASADRNALLPGGRVTRHRTLFRRGRRAREIAGIGYVLDALEKTWRRTIEGASRVFVERHCNAHARLISDIV